jgi:hypothetical protein
MSLSVLMHKCCQQNVIMYKCCPQNSETFALMKRLLRLSVSIHEFRKPRGTKYQKDRPKRRW